MPNGGVVYLTSNTNFNLASPLVYNFGFQPTGAFAEWVLEGAGASSLITQNTSSTDAIQLSNRTRVHFRGFNMSIGGSAGIAINGLGTGTSEISTEGSRFEDIGIYANAGSPSNYTSVVSLVNIANSQFDEIGLTGVPASGGNLMQLINDSTSVDYGNSLFNDIELNLPSNFPTNSNGLYISGTAGNTTNFGICTFNNCFAFYEGTTYTGIVTLLLNAGCSALTFINGDFENGDIAVKVTAAASAPTANINFFGGYFSGRTAVFSSSDGNCGPINFFGSTFANVGGGTTLINDGGSGGSSDLFSDVQTNGNGTITFGAALPPLFRGSAGSGAHWSNQGTSIQNGTGAKVTFYITHNLVTLTSGKPRYSMVVVNGNLGPYTWAISGKQISVTFVTAPPTGTGNVIMNWSAGI